MRGDVPAIADSGEPWEGFSPHAWGCTDDGGDRTPEALVFPTCVGMYRDADGIEEGRASFPHMRGDVPSLRMSIAHRFPFSPHAWGCTEVLLVRDRILAVFPTCVGMYRTRP